MLSVHAKQNINFDHVPHLDGTTARPATAEWPRQTSAEGHLLSSPSAAGAIKAVPVAAGGQALKAGSTHTVEARPRSTWLRPSKTTEDH